MQSGPSQPSGVPRDEALQLMLTTRGSAIVVITPGDTSMDPHLRGGDAVLAVPLDATPGRGDLLLYQQRDYWVVHRCLGGAVTHDGRVGLRTRGDGRNALDPLLSPNDVLARVSALRRGGDWRSLDGRPARLYAQLIAWHDLFWAGAGVVAQKSGFGGLIARMDLLLLRVSVPLVFPLFHRRIAQPATPGSSDAVC